MAAYISPLSNLVNTALKKAANSLARDFWEIEKLQTSIKDYKDFVIKSYERISANLEKELAKVKPDYAFYDSKKPVPGGRYFMLCPLDGLINFSKGIPHFAVSVAVLENGLAIYGAVYNPITDELFFAEKGKGAYKEGARSNERLRVSGRKNLSESVVGAVVSYHKEIKEYKKIHDLVLEKTGDIRVQGSFCLDLAYVAAGKLDACVGLNHSQNIIAAGSLLVKEAGGYIFNKEVTNSIDSVAVNSVLSKLVADWI